MKTRNVAAAAFMLVQYQLNDPAANMIRPFGIGQHSCKQMDDQGRLFIYSEGTPSKEIMEWMQKSANGTVPNVKMPFALEQALPTIPGCLPGKHHASVSGKRFG